MSGSPAMGIAACTCLPVLYVATVHHFLKSSRQGGPSCEHRAFHLPTLYPNTNVSIKKPFSKKSQISRPTGKQIQSAAAQYRTKKTRNFQCDSGATRSAPARKAPASSGQRHCTPAPPTPRPYLPQAITCTYSCQFWGPPLLSKFLKVTDVRRFVFFMHGLTR